MVNLACEPARINPRPPYISKKRQRRRSPRGADRPIGLGHDDGASAGITPFSVPPRRAHDCSRSVDSSIAPRPYREGPGAPIRLAQRDVWSERSSRTQPGVRV